MGFTSEPTSNLLNSILAMNDDKLVRNNFEANTRRKSEGKMVADLRTCREASEHCPRDFPSTNEGKDASFPRSADKDIIGHYFEDN